MHEEEIGKNEILSSFYFNVQFELQIQIQNETNTNIQKEKYTNKNSNKNMKTLVATSKKISDQVEAQTLSMHL